MIKLHSTRKSHHKAGKSFVLMFNRVSMYGPAHPYSVQAVDEFYRALCDLLKAASPVVLLYSRGQFFLEDDALDPSLNYFKMSSHFKKAQVASIAWMRDVQKREIEEFLKIFLDTRNHPNAERMRIAARSLQITHIRINHVTYQKVTEDDRIVSKSAVSHSEALSEELTASRQYQEALGMIAGKLLTEEVDQELSLKQLISDPSAFSRKIALGGEAGHGPEAGSIPKPSVSIIQHLSALGREIRNGLSDRSAVSLSELAAALLKMRRELQETIDAQRSLGKILESTDEIRQQAEELSDTVILELLKKEYDRGRTPIDRLAVVLRRIVASDKELRRLLPKIRDVLAGEGMPLADFWELIKRLGQDGQNLELVEWLNQGAEAIGVDGADLANRWKADPQGLARILYLVTEVERQSGSVQPVCDILVDAAERLIPKMLDERSGLGGAGDEQLRNLTVFFNTRMVAGLRGEGIDPELARQVEARLKDRLDASVQAIRAELTAYGASLDTRDSHHLTLLQRLEDGLSEDHDLKKILGAVRAADAAGPPLDENNFQQIFERIQQIKQDRQKSGRAVAGAPFNQDITLVLLEKEISRSTRYGTDLSGIAFSILPADGSGAGHHPFAVPAEVAIEFLSKIQKLLRDADWIGTLNDHLFIAMLPMTTAKEAHLTARRLLKRINSKTIGGSEGAFPAKIAGSVIHYDPKNMANAAAFIRCASRDHAEMIHRLRNLQEFM